MSQRAYTVKELDALRKAVEYRYLFGTCCPEELAAGGHSRPFCERDRILAVEEMARTHMIAGHTAFDLIEADRTAYWQRQRQP